MAQTLKCLVSISNIDFWDYMIVQGLSVSHIVGLIHNKRLHLYNMSSCGSGRRYWVLVSITPETRSKLTLSKYVIMRHIAHVSGIYK